MKGTVGEKYQIACVIFFWPSSKDFPQFACGYLGEGDPQNFAHGSPLHVDKFRWQSGRDGAVVCSPTIRHNNCLWQNKSGKRKVTLIKNNAIKTIASRLDL
jgi:hypothetical protein